MKDNYNEELSARDKQIQELKSENEVLTKQLNPLSSASQGAGTGTEAEVGASIKEGEGKDNKEYLDELKKTQITKDLEINNLNQKIESKEKEISNLSSILLELQNKNNSSSKNLPSPDDESKDKELDDKVHKINSLMY